MVILAQPKELIVKVLGQQQIKPSTVYRPMKYILRHEYDNHVLLQNVITGQLIALDAKEAGLLNTLPCKCSSDLMKFLIEHYYLVPEEHDETQKVIGVQNVLRLLDEQRSAAIKHYTILPTTSCNARCYYCFEQGIETKTMSKKTADDVVAFIKKHHGGEHVGLLWFGGEPTVASSRIDQICQGLQKHGISYESRMISNGYLFDEAMIEKSISLWHLNKIQITVDGTEENTNRIKSYISPIDNPYQRVLHNAESLCNNGVYVDLRMNYDLNNSHDFSNLVQDVEQLQLNHRNICVSSHPVLGEYPDCNGCINHGTDEWFKKKNCELDMIAIQAGLLNQRRDLPYLKYKTCMAASSAFTVIMPDGTLRRCAECLSDDQIVGDVVHGGSNESLYQSWKKIQYNEMCISCLYFPRCVRLAECPGAERCMSAERNLLRDTLAMQKVYKTYCIKQSG